MVKAPSRSNQRDLALVSKGGISVSTNCFKIGLLARNSACYECMHIQCDAGTGICKWWLRERGRGGRLNNTSAAARRVSFNFSSRFSFEAEEVHSRLPRHSLTNLLFTLRFAVLIGTPLCSSASRLLSFFFFFFLIFFFLLSFSFFFSLSLSQSRLDLSNLTFMHAHTTHNIV